MNHKSLTIIHKSFNRLWRWCTKTRLRKVMSSTLALLILLTSIRFVFVKPKEVKASDVFLKFDEGYGTTDAVNDSNAAVSAGSITGATWKTEDLCFDGKCLYFDGDGDYVSFADDPDLDFAGSDSFALTGRFRHGPFTPVADIDHETGNLSEYSSTVTDSGDLSVSTNAALNGSRYGLQAVIDDTTGIFGQVDLSTYDIFRLHFYFDPNSITMANGDVFYIFYTSQNGSPYQEINTASLQYFTATGYRLAFGIGKDSGGYIISAYLDISDGPHYIEINEVRETTDTSNDGTVQIWVDGNSIGSHSGFDNYHRMSDVNYKIRMGPSSFLATASSGTIYLDELEVYTGPTQTILAKYETAGADGGYKVYMENDGRVTCGIDNENTYFPSDSVTSIERYDDDSWHHFACVKDGSSSLSLYVDGLHVGTDASITSSTLANNDPLYIGIDGDGASNDFQGFIDEIKIYRSARTEDEVKADHLGSTSDRGTAASFGPDNSWLSNGLVGYWKMDENTGTSISDSSGNNGTGTFYEGTTPGTSGPTWTTGKYASGVDFAGTDDVIRISENSAIDLGAATDSYTVSAWFKTSSEFTNNGVVVCKNDSDSTYPFCIYLTSSEHLAFRIYGGAAGHAESSSSYNDGNWHHVVGVRNVPDDKVYLFVDGTLVAQGNDDTTTTAANNTDVGIGNYPTTLDRDFTGQIDETRIYNRALSPAEVKNLYNWAPGPVGWWKMDEMVSGDSKTLYDSSGNENNATTNDGANNSGMNCTNSGKFGSGCGFDNTDDYITVTDSDEFMVDDTNNFTVMYWINLNSLAVQNHVGKRSAYTTMDWAVGYNTTQGLEMAIGESNADTLFVGLPNTTLTSNNWYHVAVTKNGNNYELFVNGISKETDTSAQTWTDSDNFIFGNSDPGGSNTIDGKIDELKIYNYARTPGQIVQDMNAGHPAPGSPVGSAVAHWKFDEGALNTCSGGSNDFCDASGNSNDLLFSTTTGGYSNSGKFGKAFNGTGAVWASRTDDPDFDFAASDDLSISLWFNASAANKPTSGNVQYLYTKGTITSAGTVGYIIYTNSSGNAVFGIRSTSGNWVATPPAEPTSDDKVTSTADLYDSTWHNIVVTKTGTSRIDLYVDGKINASDVSLAATGTLANSIASRFADRDASNNGDEFIGSLDEMSIYRFALTADQVKTEYNQGFSQSFGVLSTDSSLNPDSSSLSSYCPPGQGSACTAPVAEWNFDESSGTSANDTSGNSNTGTLGGDGLGTDLPTWSPYGRDSSWTLDFDNTDDFVSASDNTTLDLSTALTLEAWINISSIEEHAIMSKFLGSGNQRSYLLSTHYEVGENDELRLALSANGSSTLYDIKSTNANLQPNTWYHIAVTWNTSNDTVYMYKNGQALSTSVVSGSSPDSIYNSSANLAIGGSDNGTSNLYGGLIDGVRIYNYVRTPAQIAWDYNRGGSVGWWKLDECSGTVANDSSGNDLTGTISPGSTGGTNDAVGTCSSGDPTEMWNNGTTGKWNASLDFDGDSSPSTDTDYVNIPENDLLDFSNDFSVSTWIYRDTENTNDVIVAKDNDFATGTDAGYFMAILASTDLPRFGTSASGVECNTTGSVVINTPGWHHILGIFTASDGNPSTASIYVDGKLSGTNSSCFMVPANIPNGLDFRIGSESDGGNPFDGKIDDVKIWNYVLTDKQIQLIYNSGAVHFGP